VLGRFLEFSVCTPDILESLRFYKSLGFSELEIGEVWPHRFAVVSDGDLCIGLHDRTFDAPALTFVNQELAKRARAMSDRGFDFSFLKIADDEFNQLGFKDRDGNAIAMIEARTFSPPGDEVGDSVCGQWFEVTLPARDAMTASIFWAPLLQQTSLCFKCADRDVIAATVERHGLRHHDFPGFEGAFVALEAPEGTMLYLFDNDFLGELYEVSESDEELPVD
jgi:hypothetical protein